MADTSGPTERELGADRPEHGDDSVGMGDPWSHWEEYDPDDEDDAGGFETED